MLHSLLDRDLRKSAWHFMSWHFMSWLSLMGARLSGLIAGPAERLLREVMEPKEPPTDDDRKRFVELYRIHLGRPDDHQDGADASE